MCNDNQTLYNFLFTIFRVSVIILSLSHNTLSTSKIIVPPSLSLNPAYLASLKASKIINYWIFPIHKGSHPGPLYNQSLTLSSITSPYPKPNSSGHIMLFIQQSTSVFDLNLLLNSFLVEQKNSSKISLDPEILIITTIFSLILYSMDIVVP